MLASTQQLIVAITGGIGTGKTTVAEIIHSKGYDVISTDNIAKELMNTNSDVITQIKAEFGETIYSPDGKLDSHKLSSIVFAANSTDALDRLNMIVHPPTIDLMMKQIEHQLHEGSKILFVESALVYEAVLDEGFDYVIAVVCDEKIAIERVKQRSNLSEQEIRSRMSSQIDNKSKSELADFAIENSGSLANLAESVQFVLDIIESIAE